MGKQGTKRRRRGWSTEALRWRPLKTFLIHFSRWQKEEHPCRAVRRLAEEIGFEVLIERPTLVAGGWQFQGKFSNTRQLEKLKELLPDAHFY